MSDPADDRRDEARRAQLAMRVGNRERERAVEELREHFTAGRLSPDELEDRTRDAFAARTVADLARLLHDLPVAGARPPARRPAGPRGRARPAVPAVPAVLAALAVLLVVVGLNGRGVLMLLFGAVLAVAVFRLVQREP